MLDKNTTISIIIPIINELKALSVLLPYLKKNSRHPNQTEIIVVDGGSTDYSKDLCILYGAKVVNSRKGRAIQLNKGAEIAKGNILYFLHADSIPPRYFDQIILDNCSIPHQSGCFKVKFDENHWLLNFSAWLTQFKYALFRGGDQSLYIEKGLFQNIGGYRGDYLIMEDYEIIERIKKNTRFKVLPQQILTSVRNYEKNGVFRLQYLYGIIQLRYWLGYEQMRLVDYYKKKII